MLFIALGRFYVQDNKTTSQSQKQYHINVAPYSLEQNVLAQLVLAEHDLLCTITICPLSKSSAEILPKNKVVATVLHGL